AGSRGRRGDALVDLVPADHQARTARTGEQARQKLLEAGLAADVVESLLAALVDQAPVGGALDDAALDVGQSLEVDALLGQVAGDGLFGGEARQAPTQVGGALDPVRSGVEAVQFPEGSYQPLNDALDLTIRREWVFEDRHVLAEKRRQLDVAPHENQGA